MSSAARATGAPVRRPNICTGAARASRTIDKLPNVSPTYGKNGRGGGGVERKLLQSDSYVRHAIACLFITNGFRINLCSAIVSV